MLWILHGFVLYIKKDSLLFCVRYNNNVRVLFTTSLVYIFSKNVLPVCCYHMTTTNNFSKLPTQKTKFLLSFKKRNYSEFMKENNRFWAVGNNANLLEQRIDILFDSRMFDSVYYSILLLSSIFHKQTSKQFCYQPQNK